tara:strand:+ start:5074 stop:6291 length:1218 start_codon:yes stop_codon:yes gene_type:complete
MTSENLNGVIELGNKNLKCLIFQTNDNNTEIISQSVIRSEGIHNGVIVNLLKATSSIRSCINAAEKKAKVSLKKINVVFEPVDFLCTKFSKHKKIDGSKIHKDDIDFLLKEAKKQVTLNDSKQSIIHIFNHNYIVDGKTFLEEPIDVYADSLSHEMTFISTPKNNLKNINQAFIDCDIEIERFISSTFATAVKLLKTEDFNSGVVLINLDLQKTSLGLFKNLALVHLANLPIGIDHIKGDISKVCSLNLEESEKINKKIDFSFEDNKELFDQSGYLKNIFFQKSNFRKVSKSLLLNVAKSRIDEIFEMIKKQIIIKELNPTFGTGLIIVQEDSELLNLEKYCSNFFQSKVEIIKKTTNDVLAEENFVACLGALKIIKDGWETEAIPEPAQSLSKKKSFLSKIFGN